MLRFFTALPGALVRSSSEGDKVVTILFPQDFRGLAPTNNCSFFLSHISHSLVEKQLNR